MKYFLPIILATILATALAPLSDANDPKSNLAEDKVNKLNAAPPRGSSLVEGSSTIDSLYQAAIQSGRSNVRNKQNAERAPIPLAASSSVANYEQSRGASDNFRKNFNGKSPAVHSEKNDSVIFPPSVGGVITRTGFGNAEESLTPTPDEIASCQTNSFAGASLCNITSKYPSSFIKNILNKRELSSPLFGNDLLSPDIKTDDISLKFKGDQGYKTLCASKEFLHYPRLGKTASDEWRYIIQSDDNNQRFVQGIRVEVCVKEHEKCDLVDNIPIGYEVQCVQKYIYRRLLAISPNDKAAIPDNFEFPSCCVCVYKNSNQSELRSNFGPQKTSPAIKPPRPKSSSSKP